jgi:hypothetical protein
MKLIEKFQTRLLKADNYKRLLEAELQMALMDSPKDIRKIYYYKEQIAIKEEIIKKIKQSIKKLEK